MSTVTAATSSLSASSAITWQPPRLWRFVGLQRTHILKRETNQGRSSWQGHWKGGLQLIGVLICEGLIWPACGTRCVDVLSVHFLCAFFEDSSDGVMIGLSWGHRTLLHESASALLHLPHCPERIFGFILPALWVRERMTNVSTDVGFSSLVSYLLKVPFGQGRCWVSQKAITWDAPRNGTGWPFSWPSFGC